MHVNRIKNIMNIILLLIMSDITHTQPFELPYKITEIK